MEREKEDGGDETAVAAPYSRKGVTSGDESPHV